MGALEGKVAVVTGGNSGIGLATAKRFVEEGAYVFITARRQAELDKAVSVIGRSVTAIAGDLTKLDDIDRIAAAIRTKKGVVDIVVSNAGFDGTEFDRQSHARALRQSIQSQCQGSRFPGAEVVANDDPRRIKSFLSARRCISWEFLDILHTRRPKLPCVLTPVLGLRSSRIVAFA